MQSTPSNHEKATAVAESLLSAGVRRFASATGILGHLITAIRLAQESFGDALSLTSISLERDYDSGSRFCWISAVVKSPQKEALDAYRRYTMEFVSAIPWPERDFIMLTWITDAACEAVGS